MLLICHTSDDYSLHDINIANFVMHNVINFSGMFYQLCEHMCEHKKPDISNINTVSSSIDSIWKILSVMTTVINADHILGYALKENQSHSLVPITIPRALLT